MVEVISKHQIIPAEGLFGDEREGDGVAVVRMEWVGEVFRRIWRRGRGQAAKIFYADVDSGDKLVGVDGDRGRCVDVDFGLVVVCGAGSYSQDEGFRVH